MTKSGCGKEQRKVFCPPGFRLRKLPVIRLQDAAGLAAFILFGGFSKRSRSLRGSLFTLLAKNSTRRIRLPSFPGSNSPREPLDEVTTRSEAAQVILHRMLKEVWHSITRPFVKRNRGRKPPPRGNWHPASNKNKAPSARRRRELLVVV